MPVQVEVIQGQNKINEKSLTEKWHSTISCGFWSTFLQAHILCKISKNGASRGFSAPTWLLFVPVAMQHSALKYWYWNYSVTSHTHRTSARCPPGFPDQFLFVITQWCWQQVDWTLVSRYFSWSIEVIKLTFAGLDVPSRHVRQFCIVN